MQWRVLLCVVALSTGCAAKEDTVVLLDAAPGTKGKVVVETPGQTRWLTAPRAGVTLTDTAVTATSSTAEEMQNAFAAVLTLPAVGRLYHILFDTGEEALSPGDEQILRALMADAAANPPAEVVITGFTDSVGSHESNDRLSKNRAVAVRDALIQRGLRASLIRTVGRGERELRVLTADEIPNKQNRRVEVLVR